MDNETAIGSAGASDGRGHLGGGSGEQSPLQARAAFLKKWIGLSCAGDSGRSCERNRAEHGFDREARAARASESGKRREEFICIVETDAATHSGLKRLWRATQGSSRRWRLFREQPWAAIRNLF